MLSAKMIWSHLKPYKACIEIVKNDSFIEATRLLQKSGIKSDYHRIFDLLRLMLMKDGMSRPDVKTLATDFKFFQLDFKSSSLKS